MAPSVYARDASPPRFSHAGFVEGERSLDRQLVFPKSDGDIDVIVSCSGHATVKGRLSDIRCSSADDPGLKFSSSVSRRARSARVDPAVVDGEVREVDFQFSVRFRRQDGEETIETRLNNGNNTDRLGEHYIAAQRYSRHSWPSACNDLELRLQRLIVEVAIIDREGGARDANVISEVWHIAGPCQNALTDQIESGAWIPASLDGQFVESIWVNPIIVNRSDSMRPGAGVEF